MPTRIENVSPTTAVIPAVGAASSTAVVRSLGRHGVRTVAVSESDDPPAFASRYCSETVQAPDPESDIRGYRDTLLRLARREEVGLVVPMREADVYALASRRAEFARHVPPIWPSFATLVTIHDRKRLVAAADRAGVSVPETTTLDAVSSWDSKQIVKARYPILVADYLDDAPADRVTTSAQTQFLAPGERPDFEQTVAEMNHVPIVQSFLEGEEVCLRALYHDGEAVATSQKRLVRGYKYVRGPSVYHRAMDDPALKRAGLALLDELDYSGIASVGFIRDDDGEYNLLEINARYPGSVPMDFHAGVDYPRLSWQLATGDTLGPIDYRPGVGSHLLRGELVHLHSALFDDYSVGDRPSAAGTLGRMAVSLLRQPRFDYASLADPKPFVRDAVNSVRDGLPAVFR